MSVLFLTLSISRRAFSLASPTARWMQQNTEDHGCSCENVTAVFCSSWTISPQRTQDDTSSVEQQLSETCEHTSKRFWCVVAGSLFQIFVDTVQHTNTFLAQTLTCCRLLTASGSRYDSWVCVGKQLDCKLCWNLPTSSFSSVIHVKGQSLWESHVAWVNAKLWAQEGVHRFLERIEMFVSLSTAVPL